MKSNISKQMWVCLLFLIASLFATLGNSFAATSPSNEEYAVDLVGQIRMDPLGYAEGLGYNRDALLQNLPWLPEVLSNLELPVVSDFLNQRATALNSINFSVPEPVPSVNTDYAAVGDISGLVSFFNFMDPSQAIAIVINNQFKKELDPLYEGKRVLLSSEYKLIGVSFRAGRTQLKTGSSNAYFLFVGFASSRLKSEVQVVNMINQVRANPSEAYRYMSFNVGFLSGGYSPLFLNDALTATAKIALSTPIDILAHAHYYGFPGNLVAESSVIETFPKVSSDQIALWLFFSLMLNEIESNPAHNTIFNPAWNEIGPALYHISNQANDFSKLTMISGYTESQDPKVSRVYGVVFTDIDFNGIYSPGEEARERVVSVYDMKTLERIRTVVTNNAGQFSLSLPNNVEYSIQTGGETNREGKLVFLTTDQYFDLIVK